MMEAQFTSKLLNMPSTPLNRCAIAAARLGFDALTRSEIVDSEA
jgi:hypothetical protein